MIVWCHSLIYVCSYTLSCLYDYMISVYDTCIHTTHRNINSFTWTTQTHVVMEALHRVKFLQSCRLRTQIISFAPCYPIYNEVIYVYKQSSPIHNTHCYLLRCFSALQPNYLSIQNWCRMQQLYRTAPAVYTKFLLTLTNSLIIMYFMLHCYSRESERTQRYLLRVLITYLSTLHEDLY